MCTSKGAWTDRLHSSVGPQRRGYHQLDHLTEGRPWASSPPTTHHPPRSQSINQCHVLGATPHPLVSWFWTLVLSNLSWLITGCIPLILPPFITKTTSDAGLSCHVYAGLSCHVYAVMSMDTIMRRHSTQGYPIACWNHCKPVLNLPDH